MTDELDPWSFHRWAFKTTTGSSGRKAILVALAGMADTNTGRCEAKIPTIAQGCEQGDRTVRTHLKALEKAGIIARRAQHRADGGRRGDEYLLLAPWVTEWPDGTPLPDRPVGSQTAATPSPETAAQERPPTNGHAKARKNTRAAAPEDAFPEELDPSLHEVAIASGKILKATAIKRQQRREVTRAAVGHAVLSFPDRDHVAVARRLEAWLLYENGATRPCADIVARYRNFLKSSEPMAGPALPAGVAPLHSRPGRRESAGDLIDAIRGGRRA